jgi:transposase-like protein
MAKRHSPRHRARLLDAYHSSGGTQRAFCEANRISVATLSNWLREARAADGAFGSESPQVVELSVPELKADGLIAIELPSRIVIRCEARQTAVVLNQIALTVDQCHRVDSPCEP